MLGVSSAAAALLVTVALLHERNDRPAPENTVATLPAGAAPARDKGLASQDRDEYHLAELGYALSAEEAAPPADVSRRALEAQLPVAQPSPESALRELRAGLATTEMLGQRDSLYFVDELEALGEALAEGALSKGIELGTDGRAGGRFDADALVGFVGPSDSVPPPATPATAPAAGAAPGNKNGALAGGEVLRLSTEAKRAPASPAPPAEGGHDFPVEQAQGAAVFEESYRLDADAEDRAGLNDSAQRGAFNFHLERQEPVSFGLELHDGYGRGYRGEQVLEHLRPRHARETPRDMFFRFYGDNPFVNADGDRFSTFAADVDSASYPLARNYLVNGSIPPKAAVRTEEFVNYFRSDLAPPASGDFAIHLEQAPSPFGPAGQGLALLKVGVKAREVSKSERKPLRLSLVIDSSGSMAEGGRLELVKRTLELLVDQMRDDDQLGIVTFSSDAREVLAPTAGEERYRIREAIRNLQSGGSTNAQAGLVLGYRMAERQFRDGAVNRVVLCSDGVANTGQTDQDKILEEVRRAAEHSIDITSVGVGMNNHNDVFLERIADQGNGSCHYVDDDQEARRVFVDGFVGTLQVVARDVKIQVEFNPEVVKSWRQLGYENRAVADQDFRNDAVDAGEIGAGHEVVALYEVEPAVMLWQGPEPVAATVRLRWKPDGACEFVELEQSLRALPGSGRLGMQSPRFRLSAVAAQYAEVLRRSYWAQGDSYQQLLDEAEALARELPGDPAVAELRDMLRKTRALCEAWPPRDELAQLIEEGRRCRLVEADLACRETRTEEMEQLLSEVRRQNDAIEHRLRDLLAQR